MADALKTSNFAVTASDRYILGDMPAESEPGGVAVQVGTVSGSVALVVQGRCRTNTSGTWVQIPYRASHLNGSVSDNAVKSANLTGASLIYVDAPGYEVALNATVSGATNVPVTFQKVRGGGAF